MHKILHIFLLLNLCSVFCLSAQELSVTSFRLLENDLTANTYATMVKDQNGEVAALIKVVTSESGFVFDGGMVGIVKTKQEAGEIWVYVPHGIKRITIRHPKFGVLRDYYFPVAIEKARTYELVLKTPKAEPVVSIEDTSVPSPNLSKDSVDIDRYVKQSVEELLNSSLYGKFILRKKWKKHNSQYKYTPNWYVMGQFGIQDSQVEVGYPSSVPYDFIYSDNVQIGFGYNFNEIWGIRFVVNGWESKAGWEISDKEIFYSWSWNYMSLGVDATLNLSNRLVGYNPKHRVNFGVLAGIGTNIAFNNDEAKVANDQIVEEYYFTQRDGLRDRWEGTKAFFVGRIGANVDFRISNKWTASLEMQANIIDDSYNSKREGTEDMYFNALIGVKYTFGAKK